MVGKLVQQIATVVKNLVPWMDKIYPDTQLITTDDGMRPAAYTIYNEYISVFPNDIFKSLGYFEIQDPITFTKDERIKFKVYFIVWLNTEILGADKTYISRKDQVRADLIKAFNNSKHMTVNISVLNIYEQFRHVYDKYNITERDTQFLMAPYHAVKIELLVTQRDKNCNV